ncbi:MAG: hypothetical protein KA146_05365 [Leptospiraceae bacterium]|nr:hypothetical protein [Leptospiraceae bacterium]
MENIQSLRRCYFLSAQYDYSFLESYFIRSRITKFRKIDINSGLILDHPFLLHAVQTSYMYIEKVLKLIYLSKETEDIVNYEMNHRIQNYIDKIIAIKGNKNYFSFMKKEINTLREIAKLPFNPLRYLDETMETKPIKIEQLQQLLVKLHSQCKVEASDLEFQSPCIIHLIPVEKIPSKINSSDYKSIIDSKNIDDSERQLFIDSFEKTNTEFQLKRINAELKATLLRILFKTNIILSSQSFKIQVVDGKQ